MLAPAGMLAVALIGVVDGLAGYEFGFSPFYLVPVAVVSYYGTRRWGLATALAAACAWFLAERYSHQPYTNALAIYWNTGVRALIFTVISLMLVRLRRDMHVEREQRERLLELDRLKNQFIGMAAHDLRTPLAVVNMYAQFLKDARGGAPAGKESGFVDIIIEKSDFMLRMVADLLDLSAIEAGSLSLRRVRGDYGKFVRRHVANLQALAERRRLTIDLAAGPLPPVSFDGDRLEQVLDNLIMNAMKFSPPDGTISVAVAAENGQVLTSVSDRGPGIAAAELPQIFAAFKKAAPPPGGGEKGTGLGLAIVKRVVEAHGGRITAASTPGRGATFCFTLPAAGD